MIVIKLTIGKKQEYFISKTAIKLYFLFPYKDLFYNGKESSF